MRVAVMQVLDVLVEKVQGGENDDIAVLLLGYEDWLADLPMAETVICETQFIPDRLPWCQKHLEAVFAGSDAIHAPGAEPWTCPQVSSRTSLLL